MGRARRAAGGAAVVLGTLASWGAWQARLGAQAQPANSGRFEFVVVECIDAQYLGDTPGFKGRGGNLGENVQLNITLGDPVYAGDAQVGKVSHVVWDRARRSLEIEFDPAYETLGPHRVAVGEAVWIALDGSRKAERPR